MHFKYSSVYMSIPNSLNIPSPHPGRWILNHWTTREVPTYLFKNKYLSSNRYPDAGTTALNIRYMKYTSCWAALLEKDVNLLNYSFLSRTSFEGYLGKVDCLYCCYTIFPGGSDGQVCLQCGRPRFDPWVGEIPWRRKWQPIPVLLPGKSLDGEA